MKRGRGRPVVTYYDPLVKTMIQSGKNPHEVYLTIVEAAERWNEKPPSIKTVYARCYKFTQEWQRMLDETSV